MSATRSRSKGWPFSQTEFAFLTRPVAGEMAPGMPMPTVPRSPASRSTASTRPAMAREGGRVVVAGGGHAAARAGGARRLEGHRLDLRPAKVEPDPDRAWERADSSRLARPP